MAVIHNRNPLAALMTCKLRDLAVTLAWRHKGRPPSHSMNFFLPGGGRRRHGRQQPLSARSRGVLGAGGGGLTRRHRDLAVTLAWRHKGRPPSHSMNFFLPGGGRRRHGRQQPLSARSRGVLGAGGSGLTRRHRDFAGFRV